MGAPDLLLHLRGAGFRLDVAGDKLMVAPAGALTDAHRQAIRDHRDELLGAAGRRSRRCRARSL